MQIISVVAFGNGREAYPSQHKSQVRCQWDNLTWKILLCPRTCVSALQVSCSPVLTGCACLLLPSCFHLDFKYGFTTYFHLSLAWLLWLLSHGKDEREVCFRQPEVSAGFASLLCLCWLRSHEGTASVSTGLSFTMQTQCTGSHLQLIDYCVLLQE